MKEHQVIWSDEKVSNLWNYYAKTYPFNADYFSEKFADAIIQKSKLNKNTPYSFLDFGCGPGFILAELTKKKARWLYHGVDFSPQSVEKAAKKGEDYEGFVEVQHINQLPTSYPDGKFEVIFLIEVIEHLNDEHLEGTLKEALRLLRPKGRIVITTPNDENLLNDGVFCPDCGAIFHKWQHVRSWNVLTLSEKLSSMGFDVLAADQTDFNSVGKGIREIYYKIKNKYLSRRGSYKPPHLFVVAEK